MSTSELPVICYIDEYEAKTVGMPDEHGGPFEPAVSKEPVSRHDVALVLKSAADAAIAALSARVAKLERENFNLCNVIADYADREAYATPAHHAKDAVPTVIDGAEAAGKDDKP